MADFLRISRSVPQAVQLGPHSTVWASLHLVSLLVLSTLRALPFPRIALMLPETAQRTASAFEQVSQH